jgi:antitoxin MazE
MTVEVYSLYILLELAMQTKIQKWGNSLGLRIPKSFAEQADVKAGSEVDLTVEEGELIVRPVRRPRYELKELLAGITPGNIHREVETGEPVGREAG